MVFGFFKKKEDKQHAAAPAPVQDTQKVVMGSIVAMHLVASSDGHLSPEEKEMIIEITSAYKRGLMSPKEILEMVAKTQEMVAAGGDAGCRAIFESLIPLGPIDQKFILDAAATTAMADGVFAIAESEIISKIAAWMNCSEGTVLEWQDELNQRISDMRSHGKSIIVET